MGNNNNHNIQFIDKEKSGGGAEAVKPRLYQNYNNRMQN